MCTRSTDFSTKKVQAIVIFKTKQTKIFSIRKSVSKKLTNTDKYQCSEVQVDTNALSSSNYQNCIVQFTEGFWVLCTLLLPYVRNATLIKISVCFFKFTVTCNCNVYSTWHKL